MRVLLLNPPAAEGVKMVREGRCMQREGAWTSVWAPISLATIAAVLKKEGFEVGLNDCIVEGINFPALGQIVADFKPALVIVNTATGSIKSDLSVARLVKKINPRAKVAAFGIQVTALPEESFRLEPGLDFIIRGEPEMTAQELARKLRDKSSRRQVRGLSYQKESQVVHYPDRWPIKDLDTLPFPAWEEINLKNYRMPFSGQPFLLVGTGRGCPYRCVFCADRTFYGQKLRLPSPSRVVDELAWNVRRFKVKEFLFWSESFTLNREFALGVCREIIRRGLKIRFVVNSRVDHVDQELLTALKKAGCFIIGFGVESASNKILAAMKKGVTVTQIKRAVRFSKKAGLWVAGHFVLGFPGESRGLVLETIRLACDLPFDFAQFYCLVPFPGSDLYRLALKNSWLATKDWSRFEQNFSVLNLPGLPAEETMALRRLAFRRFYFRPRMVWRALAKIRTPSAAVWFWKSLLGFLEWAEAGGVWGKVERDG